MKRLKYWPKSDFYFGNGLVNSFNSTEYAISLDILFINLTYLTLKYLIVDLDKIFSGHNKIVIIHHPKLKSLANYFFYNFSSVKCITSFMASKELLPQKIHKIYTQDRVWPQVDFTEMVNKNEFRILQFIFNGYDVNEIVMLTQFSRSSIYRLRKSVKNKLCMKDFISFS